MRVLAIDPGYDRLGIAVLEGDASTPTLVWSDCIVPPKGSSEVRLACIASAVSAAFTKHKPNLLAIETLFFGNNKKTALQVAEARGVVLSIAGTFGIRVLEQSPQEVKIAVSGYGNADKTSVMRMVPRLVALPEKNRFDDEFDAIALGIAALAAGQFTA